MELRYAMPCHAMQATVCYVLSALGLGLAIPTDSHQHAASTTGARFQVREAVRAEAEIKARNLGKVL